MVEIKDKNCEPIGENNRTRVREHGKLGNFPIALSQVPAWVYL
jgi:hypothetical protein